MQITVINQESGFRDLKEHWDNLFNDTGLTSPFLSWDWMFTWWETYKSSTGSDCRPAIFALREYPAEMPLALLPLYVSEDPDGLRVLRFMGTDIESSDYLDIIAKPSDAADYLLQICTSEPFRQLTEQTDIIQFSNIKYNSVLYTSRPLLKDLFGSQLYTYTTSVCPYLPLPASEDELLGNLSKNMRSGLKRTRNKLHKQKSMRIELVTSREEVQEAVKTLFDLHEMRFDDKEAATKFIYEIRGAFHEKIALRLFDKNWLRLYLVKDEAATVGALYCLILQGQLMYLQSGFDPAYSKFALGNQIILFAICDAINHGWTMFDFMRGNESYKYKWTDQFQYLYQLNIPVSNRGKRKLTWRYVIFRIKTFMKQILHIPMRINGK